MMRTTNSKAGSRGKAYCVQNHQYLLNEESRAEFVESTITAIHLSMRIFMIGQAIAELRACW